MLASRKQLTKLHRSGDVLVLAAELKATHDVIGELVLKWTSEEHRQGEIGFVFHPDLHGKGYGFEGATAILKLGFEGLGLHRIVGRCDGRNDASARLMKRLGMRQEAHLIQNEIVKGEWTDELIYAMLADEWHRK